MAGLELDITLLQRLNVISIILILKYVLYRKKGTARDLVAKTCGEEVAGLGEASPPPA